MPILKKIEPKQAQNDIAYILHQYKIKQEQQFFIKSNELRSKNVSDKRLGDYMNFYNNIVIFEEKLDTASIDYSGGTTYSYKIENQIHVISKDLISDIDYSNRESRGISVTIQLVTQFDCALFQDSSGASRPIQIPKTIYNLRIAEPPQRVRTANIGDTNQTSVFDNLNEAYVVSNYLTNVIRAVSYKLSIDKLSTYSICSVTISLFKLLFHKLKALQIYMNELSNNSKLDFYIQSIRRQNEKLAEALSKSSHLMKYVLLNQIKINEDNKTIPFYNSSFITYLENKNQKDICWPSGQLAVNNLDDKSITVTMLL